jgi:hypothetical protein
MKKSAAVKAGDAVAVAGATEEISMASNNVSGVSTGSGNDSLTEALARSFRNPGAISEYLSWSPSR